jgi:hypothetical protein
LKNYSYLGKWSITGNHHDSFQLVQQIEKMLKSLDNQKNDYLNSHLNADSGFDVKNFITFLEKGKMIANIAI